MEIQITGKNMDTGESLRTHIETKLTKTIGKYFHQGARANVTFSKQGYRFQSECILHLDSGVYFQATANDDNAYQCFDQTTEKIAKQIRRYTRKLKNHHES